MFRAGHRQSGPWPMIELPQVLVQRIDERQSLAYGGYRFPPKGRNPTVMVRFGNHRAELDGAQTVDQ